MWNALSESRTQVHGELHLDGRCDLPAEDCERSVRSLWSIRHRLTLAAVLIAEGEWSPWHTHTSSTSPLPLFSHIVTLHPGHNLVRFLSSLWDGALSSSPLFFMVTCIMAARIPSFHTSFLGCSSLWWPSSSLIVLIDKKQLPSSEYYFKALHHERLSFQQLRD